MDWLCSTNGEKRNAYRLLVGKPEGKRPLGRPRCRWVDNIRLDLGKVGWGDVDWIGLAQDRNRWRALVNSVFNLRVPWNAGKLSSGLVSSGPSSSVQLLFWSWSCSCSWSSNCKRFIMRKVHKINMKMTLSFFLCVPTSRPVQMSTKFTEICNDVWRTDP
jgi:hypothetical protein